ncbi:MAG TPA: phosphopantetheine-binding protein [Pyrinomonadaceae bacterium]|jgi:hypothetical protein
MTQNSEVEVLNSGQLTNHSPDADNEEQRTPSEKYIASLWSEIIGLDEVKLPHKFLDVGGNSLTLNIILNRIEAEKGVSLEAPLFFDDEKSSLLELAKALDESLQNKPNQSRETTPALRCT